MLTDDDSLPLTRVAFRDFLDATECAETVTRIIALQQNWTRRSEFGFYTLGTAAYLDGVGAHDAYLKKAEATNPRLAETFGDLYAALLGFLEYVLGEPVGYDERLALPGFHIFRFSGQQLAPDDAVAERAHFDLQFLNAVPESTPEATISFTLPLEQPSEGAGMAVWDYRYQDAVAHNLPGPDFAADHPFERVCYQTGRMVLHDGFILHAILHTVVGAPAPAPVGRRITLQGHGVRRNGQWTIYW